MNLSETTPSTGQRTTSRIVRVPEDALISVAVSEGNTATFECFASGNPSPTIQWFSERELVAEEFNFTLPDVTSDDAGTYTCEANNTFGSDNASVALILHGKVIDTTPNSPLFGRCFTASG